MCDVLVSGLGKKARETMARWMHRWDARAAMWIVCAIHALCTSERVIGVSMNLCEQALGAQ